MFGKILFLGLLITVLARARPQYVQDPLNDAIGREARMDFAATCDLQFEKSKLCLMWYWEKKPTSREAGSLIFKIYRLNTLDRSPVEADPEKIPELVLWMPSMGHGSAPTQTSRLDVGTYRSTQVFFVMPGEWDLHFQIKDGDRMIDEAVDSLTF